MKTQKILEALVKNPNTVFMIDGGQYAKVTEVVKVKTYSLDNREMTKFKVDVLTEMWGRKDMDGNVYLPKYDISQAWRPLTPQKFLGVRGDSITLEQLAEERLSKNTEEFLKRVEEDDVMTKMRLQVAQATGHSGYEMTHTPDAVVKTLHKLLGFQS